MMELRTGLPEHYCVHKVVTTARYAEVPLVVTTVADTSMTLHTSDGSQAPLSQHNAILRYIARISPLAALTGRGEFEYAQVCQWMDFLWSDIELCLHVIIGINSAAPEFTLSAEDKVRVTAEYKGKVLAGLGILNTHLATRTYMVGERLSLADVSLVCTCAALLRIDALPLAKHAALARWLNTCAHNPRLAAAYGPDLTQLITPISPNSPAIAPVPSVSPQPLITPNPPITPNAPIAGKWSRGRIRVKELLTHDVSYTGQHITVKGWIRTTRAAQNDALLFVELNDGSTVRGIQLVLESGKTTGFADVLACGGVGASLSIYGTVVASQGKGQTIELVVDTATVLGRVHGGEDGSVGAKHYPLAGKNLSLEYLREQAHLRVRSKVFSSTLRLRHAMAYATHAFFNERGFVYVHTPIITAADAEGAGEQFAVTTLLGDHCKAKDVPVTADGSVDFSKDFFGKRSCLTVSGQLNVETIAHGLSDVYTFGPTFRAEKSNTTRHLAEFWMIEPEICFADLAADMALAEDFVKYCTRYALENCPDDLEFLEGFEEKDKREKKLPPVQTKLRQRLLDVVEKDFAVITYTDMVALLQDHMKAKKVKFEKNVTWGDDLGTEHERYVCEKVYGRPTIVKDYPKGIKAFYMKLNDDGATVAAMDILVPQIGELIGGSQREENLEVLERRCLESGLNPKDMWWYLDLRKYGTVPHAGFGLGFERLIRFVTGLENIRDVIPFPRWPEHAEF